MERVPRSKLASGGRQIHQPCLMRRGRRLGLLLPFTSRCVGRLGRDRRRLLLLLGGQVLLDPVFLLLKMVQTAPKG